MRALPFLALAACSFPTKTFVGGDSGSGQSDARKDAAADALAGFECVGQPFPTTATPTIRVSGTVYNPTGTMPVQGVSITIEDASNTVVGQPTVSDANGLYAITLTTNGAPQDVHVVGTDTTRFIRTSVWRSIRLVADTDVTFAMVDASSAAGVGNAAGVPFDPTQSIVSVFLMDCDNRPQAGATMPNSFAGATQRYVMGGSLPASAVSTDSSGTVYFINVQSGIATLSGTLAMGTAEIPRDVNLAGGEFAYTALQPGP